jgi:hypothetical protein
MGADAAWDVAELGVAVLGSESVAELKSPWQSPSVLLLQSEWA